MVSEATVEDVTETDAGHSETEQAVEEVTAAVGETDGMTRLQKEHYEKIVQANREIYAASDEYVQVKAEAAHCKNRLEYLQSRLNNLIAEGPTRQQQLPYPEDGDASAADHASESNDDWRETPISNAIDATEKQLEKLADAGVRTVGQFEALRAGQVDGYRDGLRSIKGVGQKTVDKWEDEILEWLQQQTWGQQADADGADQDDDDE